ncbi:MAG: BtpA/SgcQ family protein [Candidatus Hadarchaeum sp.]
MSSKVNMVSKLTKKEGKLLIGMVHLLPLPGAPLFRGDFRKVVEAALEDALALIEGGADAVIVENYGDIPYYVRHIPIITTVAMEHIIDAIKSKLGNDFPLGINVQFDAYEAELALAAISQAAFIRVEGFVDTLIADTGLVMPCAAEVTRLRRNLSIENVQIWADVQVKETQVLGTRTIVESAKSAVKNLADVIIVTGAATGSSPAVEIVKTIRDAVSVPIIVGSGVNATNAPQLLRYADGAIVGTSLKEKGRVSRRRVRELQKIFKDLGG